eukprot:gene5479-7587_t
MNEIEYDSEFNLHLIDLCIKPTQQIPDAMNLSRAKSVLLSDEFLFNNQIKEDDNYACDIEIEDKNISKNKSVISINNYQDKTPDVNNSIDICSYNFCEVGNNENGIVSPRHIILSQSSNNITNPSVKLTALNNNLDNENMNKPLVRTNSNAELESEMNVIDLCIMPTQQLSPQSIIKLSNDDSNNNESNNFEENSLNCSGVKFKEENSIISSGAKISKEFVYETETESNDQDDENYYDFDKKEVYLATQVDDSYEYNAHNNNDDSLGHNKIGDQLLNNGAVDDENEIDKTVNNILNNNNNNNNSNNEDEMETNNMIDLCIIPTQTIRSQTINDQIIDNFTSEMKHDNNHIMNNSDIGLDKVTNFDTEQIYDSNNGNKNQTPSNHDSLNNIDNSNLNNKLITSQEITFKLDLSNEEVVRNTIIMESMVIIDTSNDIKDSSQNGHDNNNINNLNHNNDMDNSIIISSSANVSAMPSEDENDDIMETNMIDLCILPTQTIKSQPIPDQSQNETPVRLDETVIPSNLTNNNDYLHVEDDDGQIIDTSGNNSNVNSINSKVDDYTNINNANNIDDDEENDENIIDLCIQASQLDYDLLPFGDNIEGNNLSNLNHDQLSGISNVNITQLQGNENNNIPFTSIIPTSVSQSISMTCETTQLSPSMLGAKPDRTHQLLDSCKTDLTNGSQNANNLLYDEQHQHSSSARIEETALSAILHVSKKARTKDDWISSKNINKSPKSTHLQLHKNDYDDIVNHSINTKILNDNNNSSASKSSLVGIASANTLKNNTISNNQNEIIEQMRLLKEQYMKLEQQLILHNDIIKHDNNNDNHEIIIAESLQEHDNINITIEDNNKTVDNKTENNSKFEITNNSNMVDNMTRGNKNESYNRDDDVGYEMISQPSKYAISGLMMLKNKAKLTIESNDSYDNNDNNNNDDNKNNVIQSTPSHAVSSILPASTTSTTSASTNSSTPSRRFSSFIKPKLISSTTSNVSAIANNNNHDSENIHDDQSEVPIHNNFKRLKRRKYYDPLNATLKLNNNNNNDDNNSNNNARSYSNNGLVGIKEDDNENDDYVNMPLYPDVESSQEKSTKSNSVKNKPISSQLELVKKNEIKNVNNNNINHNKSNNNNDNSKGRNVNDNSDNKKSQNKDKNTTISNNDDEFEFTLSNKTNDNNHNSSMKHDENKIIYNDIISFSEQHLPSDIPTSFMINIPNKFALLWQELQNKSWYWTKGKGLVAWYYIRPNYTVSPPNTNGIHYFCSEDEVMRFIILTIQKVMKQYIEYCDQNRIILNDSQDMVGNYDNQEKKIEKTSKINSKKDKISNANNDIIIKSITNNNTNNNNSNNISPSNDDNSTISPNPLPDIMTMSWSSLWNILRAKGWHWDFGTGLVESWYIMPEYDSKNAVENVHKFCRINDVRRFIRKLNWPEFQPYYKSNNSSQHSQNSNNNKNNNNNDNNKIKTSAPVTYHDSQASQYHNDISNSEWQLSTHRRKRKINHPKLYDNYDRAEHVENRHNNIDEVGKDSEGTKKHVNSIATVIPSFSSNSNNNHNNDNNKNNNSKKRIQNNDDRPNGNKHYNDSLLVKRKVDDSNGIPVEPVAYRHNIDFQDDDGPTQVQLHVVSNDTLLLKRRQNDNNKPNNNYNDDIKINNNDNINNIYYSNNNSINNNNNNNDIINGGSNPSFDVINDRHSSILSQFKVDNLMKGIQTNISNNDNNNNYNNNMKSSENKRNNNNNFKSSFYHNKEDNGIFHQIKFYLSGLNENLKKSLLDIITRNKGTVIDDLPTELDHSSSFSTSDEDMSNCGITCDIPLLISIPTLFRRPNFLMALALGCRLVHVQWIFDCIRLKELLPIYRYLLPSGCCIHYPVYVFPVAYPPPPEGIFSGLRMLNLAGIVWDKILLNGGAGLVNHDNALFHSLKSGQNVYNGRIIPIDYIIVDPYDFTEYKPDDRMSITPHNNNKDKKDKKGLSALEYSVVKVWSDRILPSHDKLSQIGVVTTDWIASCLQKGVLVDVSESDIFSLPPQPITSPYAIKSQQTGERYTKYDIIRYKLQNHMSGIGSNAAMKYNIQHNNHNSNNSSKSQSSGYAIGRILQFSRHKITSPVIVRISPLKHVINNNSNISQRELLCSNEEILIDSSAICGKISVLSMESFQSLSYCRNNIYQQNNNNNNNNNYNYYSDENVIYSLNQQSLLYCINNNSNNNNNNIQSIPMQIQQSQDY